MQNVFHTFVSRTGVEPARGNPHYPLKVARLPISPPGHYAVSTPPQQRHYARKDTTLQVTRE